MSATALGAARAPILSRLRAQPGVVRVGVIILLLAIWEVLARLWGDPLFICPPSQVFGIGLPAVFSNPGAMLALLTAFLELIAGFALAVSVGATIGLLLGLSNFWRGAMFPIVLMFYAVPQSTVLPLFILMLGVGAKAKIIFGVTHSVFAVIISVVAGARDVDQTLLRAARSMGASSRQILMSVILPSVVPSLFTGMRLAMAGTLLGVLLAELYVSSAGVGFYTNQFASAFQPSKLFALIGLLAAMAVILNELCRTLETRFNRWKG